MPTSQELQRHIESLVRFFETSRGNVLLLSGAGLSTSSGVPDYRGPNGIYTRNKTYKPIMYQEFISKHGFRQRYWARSYYGYPRIKLAKPNISHVSLAKLEREGWIGSMVTQNVDGLQTRAGTDPENVLELHGTLSTVKCIHCGHLEDREAFQHQLEDLNKDLWPVSGPPTAPPLLKESTESLMGAEIVDEEKRSASLPRMGNVRPPQWNATPSNYPNVPKPFAGVNPDGDMDLVQDFSTYKYPKCPSCGSEDHSKGILKPDVVFFGENIPNPIKERCFEMLDQSNSVLVVGSSLAVFSSFRIVKAAKEQGKPIAILNLGTTRGDAMADLKIDAISDNVLAGVAKVLTN